MKRVRAVLGLAMLALGLVGVVPLVTGLVGYCPLYEQRLPAHAARARARMRNHRGFRCGTLHAERDVMRHLASLLIVMFFASTARAEDKAPKQHRAGPWIVIATGLTTTAIGALSFYGAAKANSDAATEAHANGCTTSPSVICPTGYDPTHLRWLVDGEHAMNWIGAIMTAVGGSATIAGVVWHFMEPVKVTPVIGPGTALVSMSVRF